MPRDTELQQAPGLWFSNDGVIVIRAENRIFRVQKAILGARSPVLGAMFQAPQSVSDDDEMIDGQSVLRLDDSAKDLEAFLRAIFDSSYIMPTPAEVDFQAVLAILRLAHKYDVNYLRKWAFFHLETGYPTTLSKHTFDLIQNHNSTSYDLACISDDFAAIPLLHEVGATWLLPSAYYNVGRYVPEMMLEGAEKWDKLPAEMKQNCSLAHDYQMHGTRKINQFLCRLSTCAHGEACNSLKFGYLKRFIEDGYVSSGASNPLEDWSDYEWDKLKAGLCGDCFFVAKREYDASLAEIWSDLPKHCGMEAGWDVLLAKRRAALK